MGTYLILRWEGSTKWSFGGLVEADSPEAAAENCKGDSVLLDWSQRHEVQVTRPDPVFEVVKPKEADAQKPVKELDRLEVAEAAAEAAVEVKP